VPVTFAMLAMRRLALRLGAKVSLTTCWNVWRVTLW
jgi:hypothetical protein